VNILKCEKGEGEGNEKIIEHISHFNNSASADFNVGSSPTSRGKPNTHTKNIEPRA
jgi:hypothetical protein